MAVVTVELEEGETLILHVTSVVTEWTTDDDPDPGEETPEEEQEVKIRAIGGKR